MKFINRNSPYSEEISDLAANAGSEAFYKILGDADHSGKIDEAEKFMLKGLCESCLNKDSSYDLMHENFTRALECAPNDSAILRNYGRALFQAKLYAQAIGTLQALECPDEEDLKIIGLSCKALGLSGKARQLLGNEIDAECDLSCPACGKEAIRRVLDSFDEDEDIWRSLSTR